MKDRYDSLDGIRAWSCLMIIMAHIYINSSYNMGVYFEKFSLYAVELVFLFMTISGFSVCCGYFEKITSGTISPAQFYSRRYRKVLPFWAVLVLLEVLLSPNKETLYEAFADLTLLFGLLPNPSIEVIGVGWFLGVVFVFYLIFPFICFVLSSKKLAWCTFGASIIYHILCVDYFFDNNHVLIDYYARSNFLYSMMFFLAGCMIYLYRDLLAMMVKKNKILCKIVLLLVTVAFLFKDIFCKQEYTYVLMLGVVACYVIYGIGTSDYLLNNRFVKIVSKYSLEMYLSHMVIFRIVEKMRLSYVFGTEKWSMALLSYMTTCVIVVVGTFCFSKIIIFCMRKFSLIMDKKDVFRELRK